MDLTDEKFDELSKEIVKNTGFFKCPVCGQNDSFNFAPAEFHVFSGEPTSNGIAIGGKTDFLRVVAMTCPKCGHIDFFNVKRLEKKLSENGQRR